MEERPNRSEQNSKHDSQGPRFRLLPRVYGDRYVYYLALLVAASAGIVVLAITIINQQKKRPSNTANADTTSVVPDDWQTPFIPRQSTLIDSLTKEVTPSRSFVLFENGTVVIVTEPCDTPKETAIATLRKANLPDARFAVTTIEDSDYLIRFDGPLFTRFSNEPFQDPNSPLLKHWATLLHESEKDKVVDPKGVEGLKTKVGLLARHFMQKDASDPKPTKILKAAP